MSCNKDIDMVRRIAETVCANGGKTYYVGGFVRDRLMGIDTKDIDIEVHGIAPSQLEEILDSVGERLSMGESFGIYSIKGYPIDIAMPRKEKLRGTGHKDFDIFVDPFVGEQSAAMRRDFTVNALMQDVLTGEILDFFDGQKDLQSGIIRHVNSKTFSEDALRVLRAAQFASRFDFSIAEDTVLLCKEISLSSLPKERIMGELQKALLKADKPSVFFETLRLMNRLDEWFPELKNLIEVPQNPKHHAEGNVWNHTMMVLDKAVAYRERVSNPLAFMLSALAHDMGKAICTEVVNGEIRSYLHETKGLPIAEKFLCRLTNTTDIIKYALNLTELHMRPNMLAANNSSVKASNKMFDCAIDPEALIYIALSDEKGRISQKGETDNEAFFAERLAIYNEYMVRPYVMGRDLIESGLKPDASFSKYLQYAHKLRLSGVRKEEALKQTLAYAKQIKKW